MVLFSKFSASRPAVQRGGERRHYPQLDSLRGLAALSVVFGHYLNLFRAPHGTHPAIASAIAYAAESPLYGLFAGHEAVMLFFVLSGFVLALPFLQRERVAYLPFIVKRYFRIYVPYVAVLGAAVLANLTFFRRPIPELGAWFNLAWTMPVTLRSVADHAVFLHHFPNYQFDPVLWSLVHELRISLAFPLMMLVVLRLHWMKCLALAIVLSFFGIVAPLVWIKAGGHEMDYFVSFHFAGVFIWGFLVARHLAAIKAWYRGLRTAVRISVCLTGYLLYSCSHLVPPRLGYFSDIPITLGAILIVISALSSARLSRFLEIRAIRFLGRISYSLYLLHCIVLLTLVHLLYGTFPVGSIVCLSILASLLVSHLSYNWVELPAIRLGKRFSERLGMTRASHATARAV